MKRVHAIMTMHASSVSARVVTHLLLLRRVSGESEGLGTMWNRVSGNGQRECSNIEQLRRRPYHQDV